MDGNTRKEKNYKELFIKMPNALFVQNDDIYKGKYVLDDIGVMVYAMLDGLDTNYLGVAICSINELIEMSGLYCNTAMKKKFKEALIKMNKLGLIKIYLNKNLIKQEINFKASETLYIKVIDIVRGKEPFTKLFYSEFRKIIELNEPNKAKILRVYLEIVRHIFFVISMPRVSFVGIGAICDDTGYDRKTVMNYIELLCQKEILVGVTVHLNKKSRNFYARIGDEKQIEGQIEALRRDYGGIKLIENIGVSKIV